MKFLLRAAFVVIFALILFFPFQSTKAVEVVYSSVNIKDCELVGEYKKHMRKKASRKRVENRLRSMAEKDHATHVWITRYDDKSREGLGIRVLAIGKKCKAYDREL